jgi:hypothetical protein
MAIIPAGHPHTAFTGKTETVLSLQGVGPWGIWYLDPRKDPRGTAAPPRPETTHDLDAEIEATFVNAAQVEYGPAPEGLLPPGAQMAVLEGDPSQPKTFTLRIKVPDGYKFPVHAHGVTDRPMVLKGALLMGIGDEWRDEGMQELKVGAVGALPRDAYHWAKAKGETVFQVWGVGPFDMRWKNPHEDPARAASN